MNWKNITINKQNIKGETAKAFLIQMPHKSQFDGFSFWHPKKLVRPGCNSYACELGYTDEWTFKLVKYGSGKWNQFEQIDNTSINAADFEEAFMPSNDNLNPKQPVNEFETHKPETLTPTKVEALDELKEN